MLYTFWYYGIWYIFITLVFLLWLIPLITIKLVSYNAFFIYLNHFRSWGPGFLSPFFYCFGFLFHFFYFPPVWDVLFIWCLIHCIKLNYVIPYSKTLFVSKCIPFIFYYNRCFVLSLLFYVMIFFVIVFQPPFSPS